MNNANNANDILKDENEITLSTGKKVTVRKKTGAHHMVENRLLSVCIPRGDHSGYGINIGDMVAITDIRALISIEAINGAPKKVPENLAEVIELMSEFEYNETSDEWSELKQALMPNKEKVEELAKNLQSKAGSEAESALR